ncbi:MAG: O-antigen ligase family protein [Burkholderiales bacterium]|nr:O-antigen ligase family protein [Burkholderiales bacterium]
MQPGIEFGAGAPSAIGVPGAIGIALRFIVLLFPALAVAVNGGANGSLFAAVLLCLAALALTGRRDPAAVAEPSRRMLQAYAMAMAAPLLLLAAVQAMHGHPAMGAMGSAGRFLLAVPVAFVMVRVGRSLVPWADCSFAAGALAAGAVMLFLPREWQPGRWGSAFLDPINFGGLAVLLGVLSLLSIDWYRRDPAPVRALKVAGFVAGIVASVPTGARGAWLALLAVIVLLAFTSLRGRSAAFRLALWTSLTALLCAAFVTVQPLSDRFDLIVSDLDSYFVQGNRDTSLGVRLQIWRTALLSFAGNPLLGLGGDGFEHAIDGYVRLGVLTEEAARYARGEMHNAYLAFAVDYGLPGLLAIVGVFAVPAVVLAQQLASDPVRRRAALLGLVIVAMYASYALSVDVFRLKMMVAFYALATATMVAIALAGAEVHGPSTTGAGLPAGSR